MKTKHVVYLLVVPVCVGVLGYLLWPRIMTWSLANQQNSYRGIAARQTLFAVGMAAMKYEQCFSEPPSGIGDLIKSNLLITAADDFDWDVPDVGWVHGGYAKRVEFCFPEPNELAHAPEDEVPRAYVRLEVTKEIQALHKVQTRLANMRDGFRRKGTTGEPDWDRWLKDCVGIESPIESNDPSSQPHTDRLP
ncbi:MAG: hypothetical protein ABIG44_10240 [Planctomycetota bacterium]